MNVRLMLNLNLSLTLVDVKLVLVIVGDGAVGGTTLLKSHIEGEFVDIGYVLQDVPTMFDFVSNDYVVEGVPITLK